MVACPLHRSPAGLDLFAPQLLAFILQSQGDADQLLWVGKTEEIQGLVASAHPAHS